MKNVTRKDLNDIFRNLVKEALDKNPNYFLPPTKKEGILQIFNDDLGIHPNKIKAGLIVEKFVTEITRFSNKKIEDVKSIGNHQVDLLFSDSKNVYFIETKNNLQLDSEKQKGVVAKMQTVTEMLEDIYPTKNIHSYILHSCATSEIANRENISRFHSVIGYDDFFKILDLNVSNSDYARSLKFLGDSIMKNSGYTSPMIKTMVNIQKNLLRNVSKMLKRNSK